MRRIRWWKRVSWRPVSRRSSPCAARIPSRPRHPRGADHTQPAEAGPSRHRAWGSPRPRQGETASPSRKGVAAALTNAKDWHGEPLLREAPTKSVPGCAKLHRARPRTSTPQRCAQATRRRRRGAWAARAACSRGPPPVLSGQNPWPAQAARSFARSAVDRALALQFNALHRLPKPRCQWDRTRHRHQLAAQASRLRARRGVNHEGPLQ
jgi:hypothetical protein